MVDNISANTYLKQIFTYAGTATGLACGIVIGWILRSRYSSLRIARLKANKSPEPPAEPHVSANEQGEYKLILVVRKDLNLGKGKAAAQCCHATADVIKKLIFKNPEMLVKWEECGQPKVVVKADDEEQLLQLEKDARKIGLVTSLIRDAGRTQIPSGSRTVLGVGPGPVSIIDNVTGHLKLY